MKKLADRSPIVIKNATLNGEKADSSGTHSMSFGPTGNQTSEPLGEWPVHEAAEDAKALWGESAVTAIAWCALSAHCYGDTQEYRFWFQVFAFLQAGSPRWRA
ncbi:hypothetical protein EH240_13055 [Mesorhizobium tamadayense]|uniref:Uncharacterized protein n=1 Tax=Mesorhizobium tamadayense TaxID=425306 RepID=A0A3P3FUW3_9HYPH|nr:hypothetical protein [Mesorhizobium tamadayense]RRI02380.1 hypothetical protein EH240_13055 [Mesorhizobium tamadayense]